MRTLLVRQKCNNCGMEFDVIYREDGTYKYLPNQSICNCEESFHPIDGQPAIAEWIKEIENIDEFTFKTIKEVAEELWSLPKGTSIDFTFDQPEDVDETFSPEGWYGMKIVNLFDEPFATLCFGSWGGGQIMAEEIYERRELEQLIKQFCRDVHSEVDVLCVSSKRNGE